MSLRNELREIITDIRARLNTPGERWAAVFTLLMFAVGVLLIFLWALPLPPMPAR